MENATVTAIVLVSYAVFAGLIFTHHRAIREAIEAFTNNFPRGGPRTPMHPSPVNDRRLLSRKAVGGPGKL